MTARKEDPYQAPILTEAEAVQAFWFLLKIMGPEFRKELLYKARNYEGAGSRGLLVRAIIQFEADLDVSARTTITVVGPGQAPPTEADFRDLSRRTVRDMKKGNGGVH